MAASNRSKAPVVQFTDAEINRPLGHANAAWISDEFGEIERRLRKIAAVAFAGWNAEDLDDRDTRDLFLTLEDLARDGIGEIHEINAEVARKAKEAVNG
jgi:hypothetical protein